MSVTPLFGQLKIKTALLKKDKTRCLLYLFIIMETAHFQLQISLNDNKMVHFQYFVHLIVKTSELNVFGRIKRLTCFLNLKESP